MNTVTSAYHSHFVSDASTPSSAADVARSAAAAEHSARRRFTHFTYPAFPLLRWVEKTMHKTAIQLVKNGCDMKFREATRHNQFDDWIAFLLRCSACSPDEATAVAARLLEAHGTRNNCSRKSLSRGKKNAQRSCVYNTKHRTTILFSLITRFRRSDGERSSRRSILRAKLIKMAVIWLETFHNQFDVSDRKR